MRDLVLQVEEVQTMEESRQNKIMVASFVNDLVDEKLEEFMNHQVILEAWWRRFSRWRRQVEEVRKMEEEEELRQHQVMLSEFVRDLVLQVEEVQTMEEVRQNKIMVGQLEDEKQEGALGGAVKRKQVRHGRAGRARGAAMKKQKRLDIANFVDMLFCQPGDVEVRREEARRLFGLVWYFFCIINYYITDFFIDISCTVGPECALA